MPAATAAATPDGESSITTQVSGGAANADAACRKRSGAGFGLATMDAVKTRSPKNFVRPQTYSEISTLDSGDCDATHI